MTSGDETSVGSVRVPGRVGGGRGWARRLVAARGDSMSAPTTTLLPFQPATMSTAQLAAVSYLARYSGRTHLEYSRRAG